MSWRRSFALLLFAPVAACAQGVALPDAQLLQNPLARDGISLNGDWRVIVDPYENGYYNHRYEPKGDGYFVARRPASPADLVEYDFRTSPVVPVPGDWNSQDERYFFYEGTVWYYRAFEAAARDGRHYVLHFGAANYAAQVWLNGRYLGAHEGGFTPFEFAAGDALVDGENFVVVKVDNRRERDQVPTVNTDWWNYGGLTRDVRLIDVPAAHVADYRFVLADDGSVAGWVRVGGVAGAQAVSISIPDLGARTTVRPGADGVATFRLDARPERWSPASPVLYDVIVGYGDEQVTDRIGFRTIETRGEDILLNGRPIFLRGISIHEEALGREGRAWSEADARALLEAAIELGCNFVRLAHYPHNEHMLRMADELGLLVWAEIPVYWTIDFNSDAVYRKAERQLDEMIARDANRASIVLWSMANETPISDARFDFIGRLAAHARELDGTRLVTAALDTQTADRFQRIIDDPLSAVIDVIGINSYCGWYGDLPADCAALRWHSDYGKPVILSEMGAGALAGRHGDAAARWTEEYQADVYRHNLAMVDHMTALRGLSPWILKDFRSPRRPLPGIQDYWNRKGLVDESGTRKAAWFVLRDYYRARAGDGS
mgnify:CR=1 FL=1